MKKIKLADVLWRAANERLSPVYHQEPLGMDAFSCNAIGLVVGRFPVVAKHRIWEFLVSLGCNGSAVQMTRFCEFENGAGELQGVRYMWLLIAMHVAEDEDIWVEVSA